MKKVKLIIIIICITTMTLFTSLHQLLFAADFEGHEDEWLKKCSLTQKTEQDAKDCEDFKKYYSSEKEDLEKEAKALEEKKKKAAEDAKKLEEAVNKQNDLIKKIEKNITMNEASIRLIQDEMVNLEAEIKQKEDDIVVRNQAIRKRMVSEQATISTNMNIEIIMGASDLIDFIRKLEGIQKITASDQYDIAMLQEERDMLSLQRSEQDRLKENEEEQKKENQQNKKKAQDIKSDKTELLKQYRKLEANLNQKMRSVKVDLSTLSKHMIDMKEKDIKKLDFSKNTSFVRPIEGPTTAGTWYYPADFGGGVHLGWDIGSKVGTKIIAPADGVILYANNPVSSWDGFLGNWIGWPYGGGNTIHMLTQMKGKTYAISFFHMAHEHFKAYAGQVVKKGQEIGATGSSGNVTGPHCHMEVINLGKMSISKAIASFKATADFAWGTGWGATALSRRCNLSEPPCRERAEFILR